MPDDWQLVRKQTGKSDGPKLSIYANGNARLNAAADRAWDQPDAVRVFIDPEGARLALAPADASTTTDAYAVSRDEGAGADVRLTTPLQRLGVDIDALDETHFATVEIDVEGRAICDVSEVCAAASQPVETADASVETSAESDEPVEADDDGDEDGDLWCGICGAGPFESRTQLAGHHNGASHDGPTQSVDAPPDETTLTPDTVRECADAVDTLSALADLLETSVGEARLRAREAGVLTEIDDDQKRMGVGDD